MTLANKLTFFRMFLSPVFFIVYLFPRFFPQLCNGSAVWTVPALWVIFVASEITDMLDGMVARKRNETSDFGKLFDPFADTLMQLTCFLCFVLDGLLPAVLFLLIIYREFGILFIRNLMLKKGIAMGARMSGKIKTVTYIIASGCALLTASFQRLAESERFSTFESLYQSFKTVTLIVFIISVVISIISFFDYLLIFRRAKS